MMPSVYHRAARRALYALVLALAACNLSASPRATSTPEIIILPTNPPTASPTPTPTSTPPPTATRIPPPPATAVFNVSQRTPAQACGVFPSASVDAANIRSGPGTNFPVLGVLPANNWVRATRLDGSGWYQVSLASTVVDGGWVSNTVVSLQQPCVCGPNNCTPNNPTLPPPATIPPPTSPPPPPSICAIQVVTAGDSVPTYFQPSISSDLFGSLTFGSYVQAVGRTADGWLAFDPGVAQAVNIGIYRLRWVPSSSRVTISGTPCATLPTITINAPPPSAGCTVTPQNASSINIYSQHSTGAPISGTLAFGSSLAVVGFTPLNQNGVAGGWVAVEQGRPTDVGKYKLRWIVRDSTVNVVGGADCDSLSQTLTLDFP